MDDLVRGVGPVPCRGMIIGEAPGAEEERLGEPFVGASGQKLNEALVAAGAWRDDFYITNAYKLRPPKNRNPTAEELAQHQGLLLREFAEVAPVYVLTLGKIARDAVYPLARGDSMARWMGAWWENEYGIADAAFLFTWHPSYVLRQGRGSEVEGDFFDDVDWFVQRVSS